MSRHSFKQILVVAVLTGVAAACFLLPRAKQGAELHLQKEADQAKATLPSSTELMDAMAKYADDFQKAGKPVPDSVGWEQLIAEGYLRTNSRSLFPGAEVTLFLNVGANESQQILALARNRDGLWSALISDGSIQQMTLTKLQEQIRVSGQTNVHGW